MAKIIKIKKGIETGYPLTIPEAVVDSVTGMNLSDKFKNFVGITDLLQHSTLREYIDLSGGIGSVVDFTKIPSIEGYSAYEVPAKEGDWFQIQSRGGASPRLYAFLDSNNKIIEVSPANNLAAETTPIFVKAPENTALAIFNIRRTVAGAYAYRVDSVLLKHLEDKEITLDKVKFIEGENLFDGEFRPYTFNSGLTGVISSNSSLMVVSAVEPNTEYIIKKEISNRFRVVMSDNEVSEVPFSVSGASVLAHQDDIASYQELTFTTGENTKTLLVQVTSQLETPLFILAKKGNEPTFTGISLNSSDLKGKIKESNLPKIFTNPENIFDGTYVSKFINASDGIASGEVGRIKSAIIKIAPSTRYVVNKLKASSRFYVGLADSSELGTPVEVLIRDNEPELARSFTFDSPPSEKYLIVYVTNNYESPELEILLEDRYLNGTKIQAHNIVGLDHILKTDEDILEPFTGNYLGLEMEAADSDEGFNLAEKDSDFIYNLYDSLVTKFPKNVSKVQLGVDGLGNPIYEYSFLAPRHSFSDIFKLPKISLTTGIHGNEKLTVWTTFKFFEDLYENTRNLPELEYLKYNIDFVIIPVVSPSGFDANSRRNHNGVNVNRNFPANWVEGVDHGTGPLSELEAQIADDFITVRHKDAFVHIDGHNTNPGEGLLIINGNEGEKMAFDVFKNMTSLFRKNYGIEPIGEKQLIGSFYRGNSDATIRTYLKYLGREGVTFEGTNQYVGDPIKWGKFTTQACLELMGNTIMSYVKLYVNK